MQKVLFFTPSLSRTGSEVVIYNIISNLSRELFDITLVTTKRRGELVSEIEEMCIPTINYSLFYRKIFNKILYRLFKDRHYLFLNNLHKKYYSQLWYVNTITQPYVISYAKDKNIPCILHIHELEHMLTHLKDKDVFNLVNYPKLIITCSEATAKVYRVLGRKKNLEVCYPSIDLKRIRPNNEESRAIRKKLGINDDEFLWVMSGTLDYNKNPVLFVDVAHELLKNKYQVHFMWIGGGESGYSSFAKKKAEYLNISDKILWVGKLGDNYYNYLNASDGFLFTSFKESFPIVALESMALGKPIVAYESGGIKELVKSQMGLLITSWNLKDFVEAMVKVMNNEINFDGNIAKINAKNFDISIQIKKWEDIIIKYFGVCT